MIPDVDSILRGLKDGRYTLEQATAWIQQHFELQYEGVERKELRQRYAAHALQGLLASQGQYDHSVYGKPESAANKALEYADALLAAEEAN